MECSWSFIHHATCFVIVGKHYILLLCLRQEICSRIFTFDGWIIETVEISDSTMFARSWSEGRAKGCPKHLTTVWAMPSWSSMVKSVSFLLYFCWFHGIRAPAKINMEIALESPFIYGVKTSLYGEHVCNTITGN